MRICTRTRSPGRGSGRFGLVTGLANDATRSISTNPFKYATGGDYSIGTSFPQIAGTTWDEGLGDELFRRCFRDAPDQERHRCDALAVHQNVEFVMAEMRERDVIEQQDLVHDGQFAPGSA